jgi:mannose-6-phosphate isomerase-like protein (cupin superfamily)
MREHQCIDAIAATLSQPFTHAVVGKVDGYCAYLSRFAGTYRMHRHDRDEMYLVLDGEIFIEYEDGHRIRLAPRESIVVRAGEAHRSGAACESLVLMFKACDLFAE